MPSAKIPSGKVATPKPTLPPAAHGILASIFSKLAAHHQALANKPDRATAPLLRPDAAANAGAKGKGQIRQPLLGTPTDPNSGESY